MLRGARAEDKLLAEAVDFTGTFIYLGAKVPGLVIDAIRNGETVGAHFGFDLLAQALANAGGKSYLDLLKERVLDPAGLKDTRFDLTEAE